LRLLDRIAGIAQIDKIDALDHPAIGDVKAGNNADADGHCLNLTNKIGEHFDRHRYYQQKPNYVQPVKFGIYVTFPIFVTPLNIARSQAVKRIYGKDSRGYC
jgi:hypothetical protein